MPYMADFHNSYMSAYFLGMSFSSFIPSLFKLVQGYFLVKNICGLKLRTLVADSS